MDREFTKKKRPGKQHDAHLRDYDLIISHYKNLISKAENPTEAYTNMGFIYLDKENYDEALKCFLKILEIGPQTPEALNNAGYVYEKMEMLDHAKQFYEKALSLDTGNLEAVLNIGHIFELQGYYHGAESQYQKAVAMDCHNDSPRFCLGVLYDNHDMYDEAMKQYSEILRNNPRHVKSLYNLSRINIQLGKYAEAGGLLDKVLELDPDNACAWNSLGLLHEIRKEYSAALAAYRKSLLINPFHEDTNYNLANIQYVLYKMPANTIKLDDIIRRLNFVISLNAYHQNAEKLLSRILRECKSQTS